MDVDIKACMDEIMFGRPEKSGSVCMASRPRKPSQLSCSSVRMQEKTSSLNDTGMSSETGGSLEKQTMSWMENSFMPKDTVVSKNRLSVAQMSKICSEKSVIDKSSDASSRCVQNVKTNCKTQTKNSNVRWSKEDTETASTQSVDPYPDFQNHALKRSSSELGMIDTNSSNDVFDDQALGCKRSKPNEVNIFFMFDDFSC